GVLYRYELQGSDPDNDPLFWSLVTAPAGMSIDPSSGILVWTPTADQIGTQVVAITVSDGQGGSVTHATSVAVRSINVPPMITSVPPTTAAFAAAFSYSVVASDANNDPLTYSLTTAPVGMAIDPTTGLIGWTPTAGAVGANEVTVLVNDDR